ncbi:MAG: N-formylglutamate amidohydrolase [Lautropia sp.]
MANPWYDGDADPGWWTVRIGAGPVIATAIHDGNQLRPEVAERIRLTPAERLREEDPHTGTMIADVPSRVVVHRSRFEVDLNRARDDAVYRTPQQAWGLELWHGPLEPDLMARSLQQHDRFYAMLRTVLQGLIEDYGSFVLLDVHSYNHRRDGAVAAPTAPEAAPEVNIGTASIPPGRWNRMLDAVTDTIRGFDFHGRRLDVRRDVAFQGRGELARFVHANFPQTGCAIAIEYKKFFMDEWTGVPYSREIATLRKLNAALVPTLTSLLAAPAAIA